MKNTPFVLTVVSILSAGFLLPIAYSKPNADQESILSRYHLGDTSVSSSNISKDSQEWTRWHRLAVEDNDAEAQFNLASLYYTGEGIKKM